MDRNDALQILKLGHANWPHVDFDKFAVDACYYALKAYAFGDIMTCLQEQLAQPNRTGPVTPSELVTHLDQKRSVAAAKERRDSTVKETEDYELYESISGDGKKRTYRRCSQKRRKQLDEEMIRKGFVKERIPLDGGNTGFRWIR